MTLPLAPASVPDALQCVPQPVDAVDVATERRRIPVVDDNTDSAETMLLLLLLLASAGHTVRAARSADGLE